MQLLSGSIIDNLSLEELMTQKPGFLILKILLLKNMIIFIIVYLQKLP